MATTAPIPSSPPSRASRDYSGLRMKADLNTVADNTHMTKDDSLTSGERSQEETTKATPRAPTVITRYYSVMDDEEEDDDDDVFIQPPPPPCMAPSLPTEGSTGAVKPSVKVTKGAGSFTEAKENPKGLDGHPVERQVATPQTEVSEASGRDRQVARSNESMDTASLSEEMDSTPSTEHGQAAMEGVSIVTGTGFNPSLTQQDDTAGRTLEDLESNEGYEDIVMLSEDTDSGQTSWTEDNIAERDSYLKQTPSNMEGGAGDETDYATSQTEGHIKEQELSIQSQGESEDISSLAEDTDSESNATVKTNNSTWPDPNIDPSNVNETDSSPTQKKTCGPPELCKCNKNNDVDTATEEPRVPDSPVERTGDDMQHVDRRPLNSDITVEQWVRGDSATTKVLLPHRPISRGSSLDHKTGPSETKEGEEEDGEEENAEEEEGKGEVKVGSWTVATEVLQGEQLLQRLQKLLQRQYVPQESEATSPSQQVVKEPTNQATGDREVERGEFGTDGEDLGAGGRVMSDEEEEQGEDRFNTDKEDGEKAGQEEKGESGNKAAGGKAQASSSAVAVQPSHQRVTTGMEADNSDDDQSDSAVSDDFSPINALEIPSSQNPILSTCHSPAIAIDQEINQLVQMKQAKERTRVVSNPEEIPDVSEIPFKTNILPKTMPTKDGPAGPSYDRQSSEQKMQREIREEIQKEQVLIHLGKIPGGYSKGTICQLKETKMLFEAFQQGKMKGQTRNRIPFRGHIYPSVPEQRRSLGMLSLKSRPISRAHSLRLHESKISEKPRCESPEGVRDSTRISPYPKQDKHLRLYRSMDSLNLDALSSNEETGGKGWGAYKKKDPAILKENPFFKLRPALALQPEVVKDIQEAREREEELRRQRSTLYGETRRNSMEEEDAANKHSQAGTRQRAKGKLDRIWPPPSKKNLRNSGQTQEPRLHKAGSQKASPWQRWEADMINGQPPKEKN